MNICSIIKKNLIILISTIIIILCANYFIVSADEEKSSDEQECYNTCCGVTSDSVEPILDSTLPTPYYLFPYSVDLSEDKYFPKIDNQLFFGSCAAWATTYYQFTYEAAKLMCQKDSNNEGDDEWNPKTNSNNRFSPEYVWSYLNEGKNQGVSLDSCYNFLKAMGSLKFPEYRVDSAQSIFWYDPADNSALMEALKVRVANKYTLSFSEQTEQDATAPVITSIDDQNLNMMKYLLNIGHPLVVTVEFSQLNEDYDENPNPNIKKLDEELNSEHANEYVYTYSIQNSGCHAMTIVGYDDDICYDLNGDQEIQDYEKGAFLLANSHGTSSFNNGYVWVMYDALNEMSNVPELNDSSLHRCAFFGNNSYNYIEVEECDNDLMVEITIEQRIRNDFTISLGSGNETDTVISMKATVFDKLGGYYGFNGAKTSIRYSRTFLFDYSDLYDVENDYYYIQITDHSTDDTTDTIVKSVRWLDSEGNVIYENGEQPALSGETINLAYSLLQNDDILVIEDEFNFYKDDSYNINQNIALVGLDPENLIYESSDTSVVDIDSSGKLTYVGKGVAEITISSNSESVVSKTCTVNTTDDYANTGERSNNFTLNDQIDGVIDYPYDVDFFKIDATENQTIVAQTIGYMDSILSVYDEQGNLIKTNDDYNSLDYNSAVTFYVYEGYTYYVAVGAYSGEDGNYRIFIQEANSGPVTCDITTTEEYKLIHIEGDISSVLDSVMFEIDGCVYSVYTNDNLESIIDQKECEKTTVDFTQNGMYTHWDINIYLYPGSTYNAESIRCSFTRSIFDYDYLLADYYLL